MKIAIGSDHRGFLMKKSFLEHTFSDLAFEWQDVGAFSQERSDYPVFTRPLVNLVQADEVAGGLLLCGSGIGMLIAANRCSGIYAGIAWQPEVARRAKEDDNINVLVLPADYITLEAAYACVYAWLTARFKEGRYRERLILIDQQTC